MSNRFLGRLITAMVTPFNEKDEVDYAEAIKLAEFLIHNGSDSILLTGTTGESPTLTHDEEFTLYQELVKALKGKTKIMAGTGSNSTRTAINSTQNAEKFGVDAILQVVPYYNRPNQEGLYQHFKLIAENTSLPVLLYNIPGRTGRNLEPETIARLSEIKNSIKEAAGSVDQVAKIRSLTSDDFIIYSGDDNLTLSFMEKGAFGVCSVASHIVGSQIKEMINEFTLENYHDAKEIEKSLMPIFEILFITSNPIPLKAALNMMGFKVGKPRLPLIEANMEEKIKIKEILTQLKLI
ncbi:MAG: 4-hydroxy-tetrahydrodipicolinate synthase [Candidatus Margulisiibacteriota bacterium]|jgi:4-hydroxy-tetrahydrodipicolinate synthase